MMGRLPRLKGFASLLIGTILFSSLAPSTASAVPPTPVITAIAVNSINGATMSVKVTFTDTATSTNTGYQYSTNNGVDWKECSTSNCSWTVGQNYIILEKLSSANSAMSKGSTYQVLIKGCAGGSPSPSSLTLTDCSPASNSYVYIAGVPDAPTITGVTAGNQSLSVAFTAPASNGGSVITKYQYSTDGGTTWCDRDNPSATNLSSPMLITKESAVPGCSTVITNGVTYPIVLRAVNSVGNSGPSNSVSGTPSAGAPPITYTVTYVNAGSGAPTEASHAAGETFTVSATYGTYGSYVFDGWNDGSNNFAAGSTYTVASTNVTLTARWKATVTYDTNSASATVSPTSEIFYAGGSALSLPTPSLSGYTFDGWFDTTTGGSLIGAASASYSPTGNITLYAHWTVVSSSPAPTPPAPPCVAPKITTVTTETGAFDKTYFYVGGDFKVTIGRSSFGLFTIAGDLPPGMIFDPNTGTISGSPTKAGTYTVTVKVALNCGDDAIVIAFDVDKATPDAISCRFNFGGNRTELNSIALANLIECVQKAQELSPNKIDPTILFSGGMAPTPADPTGCDSAVQRYQSILDAVIEAGLDPNLTESLFDGLANQVEIIFFWVRPGN